ncbi:hypothetical protein SAMN05444008_11847 [Cnuella takakiae]|uniref:Carboxypeptidase regulatory-like domain-containing protein n=2 Tax=Cnuella takakiae TaxID=1302690 RepID=A0A1M5H682_9BACT|nr:hypothetical protein BUE76_03665 [Cnuella takakiae]SHG11415.1 hypothetical protein SAMN05444008_11847 [Cnuella takakiae]
MAAQAQLAGSPVLLPQQRLSAAVNKHFFVTGETIWLGAITTALNSGKASDLERAAFVELLNSRGQVALRGMIALRDSRGYGGLFLPATIATDRYLLRVYTAGQQVVGPGGFFSTSLTIVNPEQPPLEPNATPADSVGVQFFTTSGQLVAGLGNTVGVQITDTWGTPIEAAGVVLNSRNDTLAHITTCCGGRAGFQLRPQAGMQYRLEVSHQEKLYSRYLPAVATQGMVMQVKAAANGGADVQVAASANFNGQQVFLHSRSLHTGMINNGSTTFQLTAADLPEGTAPILLYDGGGKIQAQRWWHQPGNRTTILAVTPGQQRYGKRQTVAVQLTTGQPTEVAVSVFRVDSLQHPVPERVKAPDREAKELALLTMGTEVQAVQNQWLPQREGLLLPVRITHAGSDLPASGVTASLSVPGKPFAFVQATADSAGIAWFNPPPFYDSGAAWIQPPVTASGRYRIAPFPLFYPVPQVPEGRLYLPKAWAPQLEQHLLAAQVQEAMGTGPVAAPIDTTNFYGKPDKVYLLDNYTRFPLLEEVLREYIPEVVVRRRADGYHFRVFDESYRRQFENDPLVLLDGQPVAINELMELSALKIRRLDVVGRRYVYGTQTYEGVLAWYTYTGDRAGLPPPAGTAALNLPPQLRQPVLASMALPAGAADRHTPDQRLQLFWAPYLATDQSGKATVRFQTSDVPGRYAIVVQTMGEAEGTKPAVVYFDVE